MWKLGEDGRPVELSEEDDTVRERKKGRGADRKEISDRERFTDKEGNFDAVGYLKSQLPTIVMDLTTAGKSIPYKKIEMALKLVDVLNDKGKDKGYELTASDYTRIARETIVGLRADNKEFGGI